ncbi:hypothetical protein BFS35_011650 [Macrococcoides goetzii]|uniref:Uncharacterized protein n=1 Tax=Macrococcoides goetzii TaxID=1891097 RepID=A0A2G5NVF8_9STAP|nr:hypothetical protein [Macrococcus goetzii]RAI79388.1 hypothetical protein BFS35_011650 [Macrococcus goetzii]
METFWLIVFYIFLFLIAIKIGLSIRRMIDNHKKKTDNRFELEALKKKELEKRIKVLEQQLTEKDNKL